MSDVTVTQVARNFAEYVNRVAYRRESFTLVRGKKPLAELRPLPSGARLSELPGLLASLPRLSAAEACAFAERAGIDVAKIPDALAGGRAHNVIAEPKPAGTAAALAWAASIIAANSDVIVGMKVRACSVDDPHVSPFLDAAKSVAGDKPIMVHLGRFPHTASIGVATLLAFATNGIAARRLL